MKFKDLKVGQRFTRVGWVSIEQKIDPNKNGGATHCEVDPPTKIRAFFVQDEDDIICVDDGWDKVDWYD